MHEFIVPSLYLLSGVCLYSSFTHFSAGLQKPFNLTQIVFAVMSFLVWIFAFSQGMAYQATDVSQMVFALKLNIGSVALYYTCLIWFIALYAGRIPRVFLLIISLACFVMFGLNLIQPYSLQYEHISAIKNMRLPWGEVLAFAVGKNSHWFYLGIALFLVNFGYSFYALASFYRRSRNPFALGIMFALFLVLSSTVQGILVRLGLVDFVHLGPFGFLGMIIMTSLILSHENHRRLRSSELFATSTIDAVSAQLCVLDETGRILAVNQAWRDFYDKNADRPLDYEYGLGENYLKICEESKGPFSDEALKMAEGIRSVIRGDSDAFSIEYPCNTADEKLWFNARVTHFHGNSGNVVVTHENITERKLLELDLQLQDERLKKLSQEIPGVIYQFQLFPDGRSSMPYASDGIRDVYEVTPDQVREDATPIFNILHPDDHDMIVDSIYESARTMRPWHLEYRVKLPVKGVRWLSGLARPEKLEDGSILWHGFISDINARKNADDILAASESRFRSLFDNSPVAYQSLDIMGRLIDVNQRLCELLGYQRDELLGRFFDEFWADDIKSQFPQKFGEFKSCGSVACELSLRRRDGETITVLLEGRVQRDLDGNFIRTHCVLADISDRKRVEEDMRKAKELAEHIAQAKSEFLANMSHEIRTPMNGIIGLTELALNQQTSPQVRDYLSKIASSSQSLLVILNDILDFSKLEAGRMNIEHSPFDLDQILDNLRNLFEGRAEAKHLDFGMEVGEGTPRDLIGDAMRIQQILSNLLGNAIKFTANGHVLIRISVKQFEDAQVRLNFSVEDTGIGIAKDHLDKLFQPFSQVDGSITRRFGGTGLGLAISQSLLQLMGGEFTVNSRSGRGSVFSFDLMLGVAVLDKPRQTRHRVKSQAGELTHVLEKAGQKLHAARILVVEDNNINQLVVKEFLKLSGMDVTLANDGQEALDLIKQQEFDAVLMDVHMPVMGGVEATRIIRSDPRYAQLPILALTAGVTQEERDGCMASGMNDFIAKPVNPKNLIAILTKWLEQTASIEA